MKVLTLNSLTELTNKHNEFVNLNNGNFNITEIFESCISYSFRVFENKQTKIFVQFFK